MTADAEDRHGEPAGIGVAQRAEDVRARELADQQVGGDGEANRAEDGTPAEALEPGRRHYAAGSEKLVPDLVQACLVGAHRPPSPGRQGDRLQDGRDGPLVDGPVPLPQCVDGTGRPDRLGHGGQCLCQVKAASQFTRGGHRRVERAETRRLLRHEQVLRPQVAVGDARVVQGAQRGEQQCRVGDAHGAVELSPGRRGREQHQRLAGHLAEQQYRGAGHAGLPRQGAGQRQLLSWARELIAT